MFYHNDLSVGNITSLQNKISNDKNGEAAWRDIYRLSKKETCIVWYNICGFEELIFGNVKKSFIKNAIKLDTEDIKSYREWLEDINYHAFDTKSPLLSRPAAIEIFGDFCKKYKYIGGIFIDLSLFKMLNDILDHEAGDEYLYIVGRIINDICNANKCKCQNNEFAVRDGGDEYYIFSGNDDESELKKRLMSIENEIKILIENDADRKAKIEEIIKKSENTELMKKKGVETKIDDKTNEIKLRLSNRPENDFISPTIIGKAKVFRKCFTDSELYNGYKDKKLPLLYQSYKEEEYKYIYALKEIEEEKNKLEEKKVRKNNEAKPLTL